MPSKYTLVAVWEAGLSRDAVLTDVPFPVAITWDDLAF